MATVQELARAQAKGPRQLELVDELLTFDLVPINYPVVPRPTERGGGQQIVTTYGKCSLPAASYKPLKKRLIDAGFVIERKRINRDAILLVWPKTWEGESDAAA